jgi:hypothetical protein
LSLVIVVSMAMPSVALAGDFNWPANGTISTTVAEHLASEGQRAVDIKNGSAVGIYAAADGTVYTASTGGNTACYSQDHSSNAMATTLSLSTRPRMERCIRSMRT